MVVGLAPPPEVIVKGNVPEIWLSGLVTPTLIVLGLATSAAETAAVNWVAFTNAVVRLAPFQVTMAPFTKFKPLTVKVKAGLPAKVVFGAKLVKLGAGGVACDPNPDRGAMSSAWLIG